MIASDPDGLVVIHLQVGGTEGFYLAPAVGHYDAGCQHREEHDSAHDGISKQDDDKRRDCVESAVRPHHGQLVKVGLHLGEGLAKEIAEKLSALVAKVKTKAEVVDVPKQAGA